MNYTLKGLGKVICGVAFYLSLSGCVNHWHLGGTYYTSDKQPTQLVLELPNPLEDLDDE